MSSTSVHNAQSIIMAWSRRSGGLGRPPFARWVPQMSLGRVTRDRQTQLAMKRTELRFSASNVAKTCPCVALGNVRSWCNKFIVPNRLRVQHKTTYIDCQYLEGLDGSCWQRGKHIATAQLARPDTALGGDQVERSRGCKEVKCRQKWCR